MTGLRHPPPLLMPLALVPGAGGWPIDPAEAQLAAIRAALPADFAPSLPLAERVRALVLERQRLRNDVARMQATIDDALLPSGEGE